ncbi:glycosyltransferase [Aeromonas caviae]|uniref:glycosyltransferase n=1 Tax=Aeromonas caviae TaxID=648 RepID=UPI0029DE189A|nr:glycosyltransferase [Aeromonas caviae]MDX7688325.1 glycosyltransferase [Aeromonas caviae]
MNHKIKSVTIITLTYNNSHLLEKAINSVAVQKINEEYDVEYIIADDGSTNFDRYFVRSLLSKVKFKTRLICNEKNIGTVASFNNAIKQSSGDIIIPLAADDEFYDDNVVMDVINEFQITTAIIITALRVPVIDGLESKPLPSERDIRLFESREALLRRLLVQGNFISGASTYYHRNAFHLNGYFDTNYKLLEDYPFYIKSLSNRIDIRFMDRKVIRYGVDGISAKGRLSAVLQNDFKVLTHKILERNDINFLEKRLITFNRLMTKQERIKNIIFYPDLFFIWFMKKYLIKHLR